MDFHKCLACGKFISFAQEYFLFRKCINFIIQHRYFLYLYRTHGQKFKTCQENVLPICVLPRYECIANGYECSANGHSRRMVIQINCQPQNKDLFDPTFLIPYIF